MTTQDQGMTLSALSGLPGRLFPSQPLEVGQETFLGGTSLLYRYQPNQFYRLTGRPKRSPQF